MTLFETPDLDDDIDYEDLDLDLLDWDWDLEDDGISYADGEPS
jgi:hypothetical protein